jgi:hypothetical protein
LNQRLWQNNRRRRRNQYDNRGKIWGSINKAVALFIHIPKTAGGSLKRSVPEKIVCPAHYTAREAREMFSTQDRWDELFKFAFVRNPWDRMVSWYEFHFGNHWGDYRRYSFTEWVENGLQHHWKVPYNPLVMSNFLDNEAGDMMLDEVFRFEELAAAYQTLQDKLDFDMDLVHVHASTRKPYRLYYTRNTEQIVANAFAKDIERFGYEF